MDALVEVLSLLSGHTCGFYPRDFGWPELRPGDDLGEFFIAFNLLGISIDSPRHRSTDDLRAV